MITSPLKILFINHTSDLAGAERVLLELLHEFKNYPMINKIIIPNHGKFEDYLKKEKIDYEIIPFSWWAKPNKVNEYDFYKKFSINIEAVSQIIKVINEFKPDLVYTNTLSMPWGAIAAAITNTKHVWGIHEFGVLDHQFEFQFGYEQSMKLIGNLSDAVITNSLAVKKNAEKYIDKKKVYQFYYHIDIPKKIKKSDIKFKNKTSLKLLVIGSIQRSKGQIDAVKAVNLLKKKNVELKIVGPVNDEKYLNEIKEYIDDNHLSDNITINSFTNNPLGIIKEADAVILASRNEAIARVVFESMLLKKTIIGTDSGGTPEQIIDKYSGLLYKPGDIDQLAKKIDFLIKNPGKIVFFGENAYQYSLTKFTKKNYIDKIYQLFKTINDNPPDKQVDNVFLVGLLRIVDEKNKQNQGILTLNKYYKESLDATKRQLDNYKERLKIIEKNLELHEKLEAQISKKENYINSTIAELNNIKSAKIFKIINLLKKIRILN